MWINKYALKDSFGNLYEKTPDDMHRRLAAEIARIEKNYENPLAEDEIFDLLRDFKYIVPQGGPMTGIGNDFQIEIGKRRVGKECLRLCRSRWSPYH